MNAQTQADVWLDCKYLICPQPILKTAQAIKTIAVGQTLLVETTDPASKYDLPAWARRTGHELLEMDEDAFVYRFLIRRAK